MMGELANNDQAYGEYDPSRESHYNGGAIEGITQLLDYIKNLGVVSDASKILDAVTLRLNQRQIEKQHE